MTTPADYGDDGEDLPFIHGNWNHLFGVTSREDTVRFLYSVEEERIIAMQIQDGCYGRYVWASRAQIDDVEDSLKNANGEALYNPDSWGLTASATRPDWAVEKPVARPWPHN